MINQFISLLGRSAVLTDETDVSGYVRESRGQVTGRTLGVLLPENTQQVSAIVRLCHAHDVPMVVQGGNTGRMLGALCDDAKAVVISTNRLNRIREIDVTNRSMTVESGVILADIQRVAAAHDVFFPLSIGAQGSCQIGGNLATNCGGMNTLRYGNTRDLVLGIEAVLPNGEVLNTLHKLRKNNMGYDLRHLLIGSEGTLGIITACTLKLFPPERHDAQAFVGMANIDDAIALLNKLQDAFPSSVSTFELMAKRPIDFVEQYADIALPMANTHDWYVWYRLAGTSAEVEAQHMDFLAASDLLENYEFVLAQNTRQKATFREIREAVVTVQKHAKSEIKFDVSVPVAKIGELIHRGTEIGDRFGALAYPFGHVGDGNIHFNFSPAEREQAQFVTQLYNLVVELGGSVSAEHGIGRRKIEILARYQDPVALNLMKTIKRSIDPKGLMNANMLFEQQQHGA